MSSPEELRPTGNSRQLQAKSLTELSSKSSSCLSKKDNRSCWGMWKARGRLPPSRLWISGRLALNSGKRGGKDCPGKLEGKRMNAQATPGPESPSSWCGGMPPSSSTGYPALQIQPLMVTFEEDLCNWYTVKVPKKSLSWSVYHHHASLYQSHNNQ